MVMLLGHGHPELWRRFSARPSRSPSPTASRFETSRCSTSPSGSPDRAGRSRVVLLQLVRVGGQRVGPAPGGALLGAPGPAGQDRVPVPGDVLPRLDDGRAFALRVALAGAVRAAAAKVRGGARTRTPRRRAPPRSSRPSSRAAPTTWRRSWSSRSPAPRGRPCRCRRAIWRRCARCATATTCCSSPTR